MDKDLIQKLEQTLFYKIKRTKSVNELVQNIINIVFQAYIESETLLLEELQIKKLEKFNVKDILQNLYQSLKSLKEVCFIFYL